MQSNTDTRVLGGAVVATSAEVAVLSLEHPLADEGGFVALSADDGSDLDFVARIFALPARGRNWGVLHSHNAVDIAGVCGASIYAAARGRVSEVKEGWNGGYGNYVAIDHGNGVVTKYAHTSSNLAQIGQEVAAGDPLALMGDTGHSTGCHVHFEVYGAPNSFAFQ